MSGAPLPWRGLLDDASALGEHDAPSGAVAAFLGAPEPEAGLLGSLVVSDRQLGRLGLPAGDRVDEPGIVLVVSGGAGGIAPASRLAGRVGLPVRRLETSLRDLDDLPGNARRVAAAVDTARAEGLDDTVPVHVAMPATEASPSWLDAADVVAASDLRLTLRLGQPGLDAQLVAAWVDAALDRETAFSFAGQGLTATSYAGRPGVLNLLRATAAAWDGASTDHVRAELGDPAPELPDAGTVAAARRWCVAVATDRAPDLARDLGGRILRDLP